MYLNLNTGEHMRIIIMLILVNLNAYSAEMVGSDLINYFSSTCKTQGEYTRQAISDAQSLISILENIKSDPDCVTISGGVSQLSNLEAKLMQLDSQNSTAIEIEKLKAQENELTALLSQTSDPSVEAEINSTLREIQILKASYITELSAGNEYLGNNVRDVYAKIVSSTNSLFTSIANNHRCLNKNPNILPAVTSLTGAVASAALMINPALALGIAAATDFIGNTVESIRQGSYNRMIRNISDSSIALEGYKCVLESLSDRWCSLEDARKFLTLKASIRRQTNSESGFLSAIRLYDRDIPVLLDWLNKVRTGAPPATEADASRQQSVFYREASIRAADANANGVISQNRSLYNSYSDDRGKYSILRSIVLSLTNTTCGSSELSRSPLYDIYSQSYAPYYLLGLDRIPTNNGQNIKFCEFDPFTNWPNGTFIPSLNEVKNRYFTWLSEARARVNRELTIVLQPDALQVLTNAYEDTNNKWKYSTVKSLDNLINFLEEYVPTNLKESSFEKIYQTTYMELKEVRRIIRDGVIGDMYSDPKEALAEIFEIAKLEYGVIVFQSRLEMIVRASIKEYLDNLHNEDNNVLAQFLAAESFLDVLTKVSGTDNLALISADINRARPIVIGNMNAFLELFGDNINKILKKNYKQMSRTRDSMLIEIYQRNAAEICLLLSSMPQWPKDVDMRYCLGTKLAEVIPSGPSSPELTWEYLNQNFEHRNCGHRDYIRRSKLFQEWGINI